MVHREFDRICQISQRENDQQYPFTLLAMSQPQAVTAGNWVALFGTIGILNTGLIWQIPLKFKQIRNKLE